MLSKKKQKALLVVVVSGIILIAIVLAVGYLAYLAYPLTIFLICIIVGMFTKWIVEWCIKNIHRVKIKKGAEVVKKKLKINEGVELVKESIDTLRNKEVNETDQNMGVKDSTVS